MKNKYTVIFSLLWVTLLWQGCQKKEEDFTYYDFQTVTEDFMLAYLIHSETFFRLDSVFRTLNDSLAIHSSGIYNWGKATVTIIPADSVTYPKTFLLDYGNARALDSLTGKITGMVTKKYLESNGEVNFTFVDYTVDGNRVIGYDTLRTQQNQGNVIDFTFMVRDGLILKPLPDGGHDTITFGCIEYPQFSDINRQFTIKEGYAAGLSSDSLNFSLDVDPDSPLLRDNDCPFIGNGILNFHIHDYFLKSVGEGIIHFGFPNLGACDKYALVVINGDGYQIQMDFVMN